MNETNLSAGGLIKWLPDSWVYAKAWGCEHLWRYFQPLEEISALHDAELTRG